MNALTQTKPRPQLGPSMDAPSNLSREFMSMMFLRLAAEYAELAAGTTGAGTRLIREQAELARQHAHSVRLEPVPRVVYVTELVPPPGHAGHGAGGFVYWKPGESVLCEPMPWSRVEPRAKEFIQGQNNQGARLHPWRIRFDPPVGL